MNGKQHLLLFYIAIIPYLVALIYFKQWIYIPITLAAFFIVDPDDDQKFPKLRHRYFLFHSAFWPLIIFAVIWPFHPHYGIIGPLCMPVAIHLLGDLKPGAGTANIFIAGHRMSKSATTVWLSINALICLMAAALFLWIDL